MGGTASPQGKARAWREQSLAPVTVLPPVPEDHTTEDSPLTPCTRARVLQVTSKFHAPVLLWP